MVFCLGSAEDPGRGRPVTDKLPDWKRIATADFKIRLLQLNLHGIRSKFIGQSIVASISSLGLVSEEISKSDADL